MVAVMYTTWIDTQSQRMEGERRKKKKVLHLFAQFHWTIEHTLSKQIQLHHISCPTLQNGSETQLHTQLAQNDSGSHFFFLDVERTAVVLWPESVPSLRTWHLSTGWNRVWRPPRPGTGSSPSEAGPGRGYPCSHEDVTHPVCRRTQRKTYISYDPVHFPCNSSMVRHVFSATSQQWMFFCRTGPPGFCSLNKSAHTAWGEHGTWTAALHLQTASPTVTTDNLWPKYSIKGLPTNEFTTNDD